MPQIPGLLGLSLSGAGPSVVALATAGFDEIGKAIAARFEQSGVAATIRFLEVAQDGLSILENRPDANDLLPGQMNSRESKNMRPRSIDLYKSYRLLERIFSQQGRPPCHSVKAFSVTMEPCRFRWHSLQSVIRLVSVSSPSALRRLRW